MFIYASFVGVNVTGEVTVYNVLTAFGKVRLVGTVVLVVNFKGCEVADPTALVAVTVIT